MKLVVFLAVIVLVFDAALALDTDSGSATRAWRDYGAWDCPGVAKLLQEPDPSANLLAAQEDGINEFRIEAADDFPGDGGAIQSIGWWGGYWAGSPVPPDVFGIAIYAMEEDECPGDLLYSELDSDYHEILIGTDADYCVALDENFHKAVGETYQLSIVAYFTSLPQWGWASTIGGNGRQACFRSAYFGYADWTPGEVIYGQPYETAFILFNDPTDPVESHSWTTIKNLYRR